MSIDKKRIGKILKVTAIGTGVTFLGLNMIAKKKKGELPFLKKKKNTEKPIAYTDLGSGDELCEEYTERLGSVDEKKWD